MDKAKILYATCSYLVLTMLVAYPWHMIWFHDAYLQMGAYTRPEPVMPMGMSAMIVQGVVIAYLFPIYYRGGNPIIKGIEFSLLMGAVVYSVMGFAMVAKIDINPLGDYLLYNLVFQLIQFVLTGIALGWIYRGLEDSNRV